ncbi:hypothetical protein TELCIR_19365 [Teladorsagia circumcincta]|uniref:Peptidase M13 C-terminal domain-containing protein n=1 Tax=Teladorsagia circumcincta TaxID=45464 RepID=A0A2G9TPD1_TELCI|nr:hypothetical protein TELCIR_19365 [Teladorsagia circumcincta]
MDRRSKKGFRDMAQCVVTQYSTQCCPVKEGYVHCANGATTQGENIADIGGERVHFFVTEKDQVRRVQRYSNIKNILLMHF